MGATGGENHSLKRNVHRVLTSEVINRDFHKHGIVASQKRLFLRPGASAEGVINDATCIVLAERVIGDEPVGDLGFLSDEQFEQFVRIQQKTGVGDFHAKNFYVNRDPRRIILFDTEVNCAKSETWDDLYLGRLAFQHPAVFKARLCAPVHAVEQEDLLRHRLVALAMLLPSPSSVDGSAALFRESLSEYITSLCENGYILGPYKEKLEKHWGDVVFDEFLKEPDWKKKYALLKRIDASREPSCAATHKRKR